jgi:hypothetical protein
MDKSSKSALIYDEASKRWSLVADNVTLGTYAEDDLRVAIVYRARCFAKEEDAVRYRKTMTGPGLGVEHVLKVLQDDLVQRGVLTPARRESIPRMDLAMMLLDTYVKYPLPSWSDAIIPYNYCALPKMAPKLGALARLVC